MRGDDEDEGVGTSGEIRRKELEEAAREREREAQRERERLIEAERLRGRAATAKTRVMVSTHMDSL
jgi:hypothetical protein